MNDNFGYRTRAPIQRIVVFRALYLGDLLCATPALRALRCHFPAAEITLIGQPWAQDLVGRLNCLDRLLVFPGYPGLHEAPYDRRRTDAFLARARASAYNLAIQMHGDGTASNAFVAGLGAEQSLGYRRGSDDRLTASLPYQEGEHEILRWMRLVATTGATADDTRIVFPYTRSESGRAASLLRMLPEGLTGPVIGLHSGARDPARRWPPEHFAQLADALVEQVGARIVLTGSTTEATTTAAIRRAMRFPALDLAGATDLGTLAALLARLTLLVTNDTGASHLAAATGTYSVVLFGPSRPAQWAPLNQARHLVIDSLALAGPGADPATALGQVPVAVALEACAAQLSLTGDRRPVHASTTVPPAARRPSLAGRRPSREQPCAD